jgi:hypothetical protein
MNNKIIITLAIAAILAAFAVLVLLVSSPLSAGTLLGYLAVVSLGAIIGLEYGLQRRLPLRR